MNWFVTTAEKRIHKMPTNSVDDEDLFPLKN